MKKIVFIILCISISACSPKIKTSIYQERSEISFAGQIPIFTLGDELPDEAEILGKIQFRGNLDFGCTTAHLIDELSKKAKQSGANGNKIIAGIPLSNAFGQGSGESKLYEFDTSTDSWNEILTVNGELAGSQSGSIVYINGSGDIFSIGADGILPQVRVFGDNILSTTKNTSSTFKLYPNPSQGEVFLGINQESQLQVFDLNGRLVKNNQTLNPGKNIINLERLESGFYFIKILNVDGQEVKKLMVL